MVGTGILRGGDAEEGKSLFTISRILALIAAIIFILAALGIWPDSLRDDIEPVALGLAIFALSFAIPDELINTGRRS